MPQTACGGAPETVNPGETIKASDPVTGMTKARARNLSTDALAYMGDAVYETFVRQRLLTRGIRRADRLHRAATAYVSAAAQARIIRSIFDSLPEEDRSQVKRWRNHKYHSKAKNADPMTYKWATAFEALIGYLHLTGDAQRLEELLEKAAAIIEEG